MYVCLVTVEDIKNYCAKVTALAVVNVDLSQFYLKVNCVHKKQERLEISGRLILLASVYFAATSLMLMAKPPPGATNCFNVVLLSTFMVLTT